MSRNALVFLWFLVALAPVWGQTPEEKKATIEFVRGLQTSNGGFLPGPSSGNARPEPSLRAATAGLRSLKYFGGEPRDRDGCMRFVEKCFDKASGGFVDRTDGKGKPEVVVTAVGLMAVVELKMPRETYVGPAVKFLEDHAASFEEIRMAAAGLESIGVRSAKADQWTAQVDRIRNPDGTFGQADDRVRSTGGAAAALLRLGARLDHRDDVIKTLKMGQRQDGAYGKAGVAGSDLETTYRVVRALRMLKEQPAEVARCRSFVARCRNPEGGYAVTPNAPSTISATYFAGIILHWLDE
jgi:prenyltransferase beta subunit